MEVISSRTPEGQPNRCPVCGQPTRLEPSCLTPDAPCPSCGHLLWFPAVPTDAATGSRKAPQWLSLGAFTTLAQLCSRATVRFGQPRPEHLAVLMRITEAARWEQLLERATLVASWDELLADVGGSQPTA
jgi:hypothetical protein